MDERPKPPVRSRGADLPTTRPATNLAFSSSAGGFALSRRHRQEMDARFNRAQAENLRAQADVYRAAGEFSDAKFDLAVILSRWQTLPDVIAHMERKGFMERANELAVLAVELDMRLIKAQTGRAAALQDLQAYQPEPPPPPAQAPAPAPPSPTGLSPAEIEDLVRASLPEVTPDTLRTLTLLLQGRLAEKKA